MDELVKAIKKLEPPMGDAQPLAFIMKASGHASLVGGSRFLMTFTSSYIPSSIVIFSFLFYQTITSLFSQASVMPSGDIYLNEERVFTTDPFPLSVLSRVFSC